MASEWFYTSNGQQAAAPVSSAQLRQLAIAGQLLATDLVWQEGMASWAPAASIKGLLPSGKGSSDELPVPSDPPSSAGGKSTRSRRKQAAVPPETPRVEAIPPDETGLLALHPVVVLLLSLCTSGLFGLLYAYIVCNRFADTQVPRTTDGNGRPLGRPRHPLTLLVLSYLTLGLYLCYWLSRSMEECAAFLGQTNVRPRIELSLMLALPPYAVYVAVFRLPELIRAAREQTGQPPSTVLDHAPLFLVPCLTPALPLLGMAQQDLLNRLWTDA